MVHLRHGMREIRLWHWLVLAGAWWIVADAWVDGRVLMMVDQWREWWTVVRWWGGGDAALPRTTSGFGVVPPGYIGLLWPMAALGIPVSTWWALPVLVGAGLALVAAAGLGGATALTLLAFALFGAPGLFWLYANVSASWGWIFVGLGWALVVAGRLRLGLAAAAVGATFGYVVLPAFCGVLFWVVGSAPRMPGRWVAAALAAALPAAVYGALAAAGAPTATGDPVGGLGAAAAYVVGGRMGATAMAVLIGGLALRRKSRLAAAVMAVVWAGTAVGVASKTNYWAWHYTATTVAALLLIAAAEPAAHPRWRGWLLVVACLPTLALTFRWFPTPVMRPVAMVHEPGVMPVQGAAYHVNLTWQAFEAAMAVAGGRRVRGEYLPLGEWAQLYADTVTRPGEAWVATRQRGPWCEQAYRLGCSFAATATTAPPPVSGPVLLEAAVGKGGLPPNELAFVGRGCATESGRWVLLLARESAWVDQYSRWKFAAAARAPACEALTVAQPGVDWAYYVPATTGTRFYADPGSAGLGTY